MHRELRVYILITQSNYKLLQTYRETNLQRLCMIMICRILQFCSLFHQTFDS